jgi:signal transduction histidine kinase
MPQTLPETHDPKHRIPFFRFWALVLVIGTGVLGSIVACVATRAHEEKLAQANFERDAINIAASFEKDLDRYVDLIYSLRSFFEASEHVSRADFRTFCEGPLRSLSGIQALEWVPRVPLAERAAFEQRARQDGHPTFQFTERDALGKIIPAAPRAEYFPVYYAEPLLGNESALGHDPLLAPRIDALAQARDTGKEVASGRLTLIQETSNQPGVAIFLPIYRGGVPEAIPARRAQLLGFAEGVFRVDDMVEASLAGLSMEGMGIQLVDYTDPKKPDRLFRRGEPVMETHPREFMTAIDFGGRQWRLSLYPTAPRGKGGLPLEAIVLGGGLFITTLTGAYLFAETTRNAKIARLVDARTTELRNTIAESTRRQGELEQVRELDRLKTNFVGAVSHDLRTPLTSIMGYAEFLEDGIGGDLSGDQQAFVTQIMKSADRLEMLVNDLLDFARLDAGTFKLALQTRDLQAKLIEVAESLRPQIEEAKLTLEIQTSSEPLLVPMDVQRIERVLINFLSNAIKFTLPGGRIRLEARREGESVICEVSDNGEGIAEEDLSQLFQRFSQLKNGQRKGGTGLGLSICKAIIEAHGGEIGVRSAIGQGSTFWFSLPV